MTKMKTSPHHIEVLKENGQDDSEFLQLLDLSLQQASKIALFKRRAGRFGSGDKFVLTEVYCHSCFLRLCFAA